MSFHTPPTGPVSVQRPGMRALTLVLTPALVFGWLTAATASPAAAATVTGEAKAVRDGQFSAQELGTVQINGVVWDQEIVGNTVYVAGDFSTARPAGAAPGQQEVPRANLLAYDVTTGKLVEGWAPSVNAQVKSIEASPDGQSLYIGGSFTELNGAAVSRIAKISAKDGSRDTRFRSNPVATVNSIAVGADETVYYGGVFGQVGLTARKRVAAVDATTGALKPLAPNVDGGAVWTVALDDQGDLLIGGAFTSVNGSSNPGYGMAKVSVQNGALQPWSVNSLVRNGGARGAITSLVVRDGVVYGTGFMQSRTGNNFEGTFAANAADGSLRWLNDCHGDSYDTVPAGDTVYSVNHAHDCSTLGEWDDSVPYYRYGTAMTDEATGVLQPDNANYWNFAGNPSPTLRSWEPTYKAGVYTTSSQASWTVETNGDYLVYGGEFLSVNGRPQQGLVRFPAKRLSDKYPPYLRGDSLGLAASPNPRGGLDLIWEGSWDRDSRNLTYELIRNGNTAQPVDVQKANSTSWSVPSFSFHDTTAEGPNTYQVIVKDPQGNSVQSNRVSAVSASPVGSPNSPYGREVLGDSPQDYWRLGDPPRSGVALNEVRDNALRHNATVSAGVRGALAEDTDPAARYSLPGWFAQGGSASAQSRPAPAESTTELWFNTTSTRGGQLMGFGNRQSGTSSQTDRMLMMESDGSLVAGVNSGGVRTVKSQQRYNDGAWHHAVVTLSGEGHSLYVDGQRVAHDPFVTQAAQFNGYWRVGGDTVSSWNLRTKNAWFEGALDEVAVYPRALDADSVARHHLAGTNPGRLPAPGAPVADQDPLAAGQDPKVAAPDPKVAAPDPKVVAPDPKPADPDPKVAAPDPKPANQNPQAVVSLKASGLKVTADAQQSSDPDGEISRYAWDFGDDTTADGATAQHTYQQPGTYRVVLTVTDNHGGTATSTETVTVAAPEGDDQQQVFVEDNFNREVAGGMGTADTGGAWVPTYQDADVSVTDGSLAAQFGRAGVSSAAYMIPESTSTDLRATVALDKLPNGNGMNVSVQGRRVGSSDYRVTTRITSSGSAVVSLVRADGAQLTTLATRQIGDLQLARDERLSVRLVVDGTSPTELKAKVWKQGQPEPEQWLLTAQDNHAPLQAPGSVGYMAYLSASATNLPVTFLMDSFMAAGYVAEKPVGQDLPRADGGQ